MRKLFDNNLFSSGGYKPTFRTPNQAFMPSATTMSYTRGGMLRQYLPFIAAAALLLLIAFLGYSCANAAPVKAKINGERIKLEENTTITMAVSQAELPTAPGRLLALDGSVLDETGGTPFTALVNGEHAQPHTIVANGDDITITPGQDITEASYEKPFVNTSEVMTSDTWGAIREITPSDPEAAGVVAIGEISGLMLEKKKAPQDQVGILTMYDIETDEKVMAFTFDDGPWEETTAQVLDILKEYDAKATFFVLGANIDASPEMAALVKREYEEGHQICTHTYSHAAGTGGGYDLGMMLPEERIDDVLKGQEAIAKATGVPADRMFRSPGGNYSTYTAHDLSPYISYEIGWNIDSEDWRKPGVDVVVDHLLSVEPGNIVLMHDGGGDRSQTVEALRKALPKLKEEGWKFVTVAELMKYNTTNNTPSESENNTGSEDGMDAGTEY